MDEENVDISILGSMNYKCLTNSEVYVLLNKKKEKMPDVVQGSVFEKTYSLVKKLGGSNGEMETTKEIRKELCKKKYDLKEYEIALFANLMPGKVEEAQILIPSLKDKSEDLLQELVDFVSQYVDHQFDDDEDNENNANKNFD